MTLYNISQPVEPMYIATPRPNWSVFYLFRSVDCCHVAPSQMHCWAQCCLLNIVSTPATVPPGSFCPHEVIALLAVGRGNLTTRSFLWHDYISIMNQWSYWSYIMIKGGALPKPIHLCSLPLAHPHSMIMWLYLCGFMPSRYIYI